MPSCANCNSATAENPCKGCSAYYQGDAIAHYCSESCRLHHFETHKAHCAIAILYSRCYQWIPTDEDELIKKMMDETEAIGGRELPVTLRRLAPELACYTLSVNLSARPSTLNLVEDIYLRPEVDQHIMSIKGTYDEYMDTWEKTIPEDMLLKWFTEPAWEVPMKYRPISELEKVDQEALDDPKYGIEIFPQDYETLDFFRFRKLFVEGMCTMVCPWRKYLFQVPDARRRRRWGFVPRANN